MSTSLSQNKTVQTPRNICDVITTLVMSVIPAYETELLKELITIFRNASYTAPEAQQIYWQNLITVFNTMVSEPLTSWQKTAQRIINDA